VKQQKRVLRYATKGERVIDMASTTHKGYGKENDNMVDIVFSLIATGVGALGGSFFGIILGLLGGVICAIVFGIIFGSLSVEAQRRGNGFRRKYRFSRRHIRFQQ